MHKGRLEAFSDGVLAIIITIMVLELKAVDGATIASLRPLIPIFLSYILSFVYIGIYWNNHHHLLHSAEKINGAILWANLYLLFWLSLIPFVTAWMGENDFAAVPVSLYCFVMLMAAIAYFILSRTLIRYHGQKSPLAKALGKDYKGKISILFYAIAIPIAFLNSFIALAIQIIVAAIWFVPDRRFEK